MVMAFLLVISLVLGVIINLGCAEILQTRVANDLASAQYVALAGAERMYAKLKSQEGNTITWPQTISQTSVTTLPSGGTTVGTFTATANTITSSRFGIVSEGVVNGRRATVTVKYGMNSPFTNGHPIGSIGPMTLAGNRWLIFRSWIRAEGPIASGSTITTNNYVQVSGSTLQNQSFTPPSFWYKWDTVNQQWTQKTVGDANGDGQSLADTNSDGKITVADAGGDQALVDIFTADDTYSDGEVNEKDAFYTYYTKELNTKENLGIAPGEAHYYNGNQDFNPTSVPSGTPIIFVNGNADILFSDTSWWGAASNHTVVAMGDITTIQPTNGSDDTLALISYGDVVTGGVNFFANIKGNLVVYANGNFSALYGGKSNGSLFAKGSVDIDTVYPVPGLLNRDIAKGTLDWGDSANWPLGLPPNYNRITLNFTILNENADEAMVGYKPRTQRK